MSTVSICSLILSVSVSHSGSHRGGCKHRLAGKLIPLLSCPAVSSKQSRTESPLQYSRTDLLSEAEQWDTSIIGTLLSVPLLKDRNHHLTLPTPMIYPRQTTLQRCVNHDSPTTSRTLRNLRGNLIHQKFPATKDLFKTISELSLVMPKLSPLIPRHCFL